MKIYCNSSTSKYSLADFVGEDLWVRAKILDRGVYYYLYVIKKHPDEPLYVVYQFPESYIGHCTSKLLFAMMNNRKLYYDDEVDLSNPLTAYPTDEFASWLDSDRLE